MTSEARKQWRELKKYSEAMKGRPANLNLGPLFDGHMKDYDKLQDAVEKLSRAIDSLERRDTAIKNAFQDYARQIQMSAQSERQAGRQLTAAFEENVLKLMRDILEPMIDDLDVMEHGITQWTRDLKKCRAMLLAAKARTQVKPRLPQH